MRNAALKPREIEPDVYLPFGRHVTDTVIGLTTRALLTVIRLDGTSFETAETSDLNDLHGKLNLTLRNVADPHLALWSHLARRRTSVYPDGAFRSTFAAELDAQYREQLCREALFRNDLYLTLVYHPGRAATDTAAAFFRRLGRGARHSVEVDSEALKRLDDATRDIAAALERYGARAVGLVERGGVTFSEPMELLHALASGEWMPMPLPQGPIGPALYSNRIIFGRESSARGTAATALDLVYRAADLFRSIEEQARETEARAKEECRTALDKLRQAEMRAEVAERAQRELIINTEQKLQDASRALEQAKSRVQAQEDRLTAIEVRAQVAEADAQQARHALALVEEAIRRRLLCTNPQADSRLTAAA